MHSSPAAPPAVLFVCTLNYYRSRFAHLYFNHLAKGTGLHAESRGLVVDRSRMQGMSYYAGQALQVVGVAVTEGDKRDPVQLTELDIRQAGRLIALCRSEHEPVVAARFPNYRDRFEYWDVLDIDARHTNAALGRDCRRQVEQLWMDLRKGVGIG
ncbi:MAG: hypothetical protein OXH72_00795 [Caldilineaceae bacterium]|nr:hypothetical protein [Caldilineaceae bacterium]